MSKTIKEEDLILAITKDYRIINNAEDVNQAMSVSTFILNHVGDTISAYMEENQEFGTMTKQEVIDKITESVRIYDLSNSGMSSEDIEEVLGLDKGSIRGESIDS